jgi:hypothetical protein
VSQYLRIDVQVGADQDSQWWQRAQLVVGEVAAKLVLGSQAGMVVAHRLADKA